MASLVPISFQATLPECLGGGREEAPSSLCCFMGSFGLVRGWPCRSPRWSPLGSGGVGHAAPRWTHVAWRARETRVHGQAVALRCWKSCARRPLSWRGEEDSRGMSVPCAVLWGSAILVSRVTCMGRADSPVHGAGHAFPAEWPRWTRDSQL